MLKLKSQVGATAPLVAASTEDSAPLARLVVDFFRLHLKLILLTMTVCLLFGVFQVASSISLYTASSTLLLDDNKVDLFQRPSVVFDQMNDSGYVESQIEVIRSETVAREVVRMLGLVDKPTPPPKGFAAWLTSHGLTIAAVKARIMSLISPPEAATGPAKGDDDREGEIARGLLDAVSVRRVGMTSVVGVSVTAESPEFAQQLANAFPEAYVVADISAKQASTKRAIVWLDERLKELRLKSAEADQAVENFRRDRGTNVTDRGLVSSQLRQLESTATSYKNLYDTLQTRYLQAVQEQSFITTKARVISTASLPTQRSSPKTTLTLAGALLAGFVFGIGIGLVKEALRRPVHSASTLEAAAGVECLAVLPRLSARSLRRRILQALRRGKGPPLARYVVQEPFTPYSEEMRRLGISLRQRRTDTKKTTILGIVSLHPADGKSTVASNLAQSLGLAGCQTLLVDMDFRNPQLSSIYDPPSSAADIFDAADRLDAIWRDPLGQVDFLTGSKRVDVARNSRLFDSAVLEQNFRRLSQRYEFIIIDLPPVLVVADAAALKHLVDAFLLVVASRQTGADEITETMNRFDPQRTHVAGAILNKADVATRKGHYGYYMSSQS